MPSFLPCLFAVWCDYYVAQHSRRGVHHFHRAGKALVQRRRIHNTANSALSVASNFKADGLKYCTVLTYFNSLSFLPSPSNHTSVIILLFYLLMELKQPRAEALMLDEMHLPWSAECVKQHGGVLKVRSVFLLVTCAVNLTSMARNVWADR